MILPEVRLFYNVPANSKTDTLSKRLANQIAHIRTPRSDSRQDVAKGSRVIINKMATAYFVSDS